MKRLVVLAGLLFGAGSLLAQNGQVQVGNFGPDFSMSLMTIGTITSTFTADLFPPLPKAITVDGATLTSGTAPVGCATFPVLNVWDNTAGSSIANVALTSGTNTYTMTVAAPSVPANHVIAMRISVAPVTCGTNAQNIKINVLYR